MLTVLVDLLARLYQLQLSGHLSHGSHTIHNDLESNETIFVLIKLLNRLAQLHGVLTETDRT